ncbi:uncharacterized protein LOC125226951, partial [Leguminivora glycinivorella]|uniref:uncharacterized protein LOC125226951 n=1 Tax=Leguminivora glycinivorella TaxID=1035111 RepID=UPI00200DB37B
MPTPTLAGVGVPAVSNRLCVIDRNSRERYLVDTGAEISVLSSHHKKNQISSTYKLYAANNTPIKTYGDKTITLNLGLRRDLRWTFVIADIKTSILGADFIRHYKLLIDLDQKKLIDKTTKFQVDAVEVSTTQEAVYLISSDQEFYDILREYPDVLRPMSVKTPAKHSVQHFITTTGPPLFARPRPLPPDKYAAAKAEFERLMAMGICEPSNSPWASPLHVVTKKDGTLRVCGDYRRLNAVTQPDRYPLPRIQDFTYQLHNKKIFSKLDLKMAYFWIPMNKEDAQKTSIITPFGLFKFNSMTFGLRNSSQTFQRFMHDVLRGIDGCFCFVDDLLLSSYNEEEHKTLLRQVLERLDKYGVTLNVDKCEFGRRKINFLGYEVSSDGISPTQERIQAISNYPKPKTVCELRRFLGMLNFYRDCLPHQAELQSQLNKYLHNSKKNDKTLIEWNPETEEAFIKCRQSILKATTLSYPVHGAPLSIMTDASDHSLGGVVQQKVDNAWKPLAFFSKAMSPTQRRYSTYDRELLAIYTAIKHFRRLIEGNDVIVYTDHRPLTHALTRAPSNSDTPRRERQLHFISQFCSSIQYIPGDKNNIADALSRIEEIQCPTVIDYEKLATDQHADEELKTLKTRENLKFIVVALPGISQPITSMNRDVAQWTRACIGCQRAKVHRHVIPPIGEFPQSQRFEHLHIDIVGPLKISNSYRYCVTMIDRCTKWPEAVPVRDITAEVVAKVLYEHWITRFGCPLRITTDQGRTFESSLFNALLKKFGTTRIRTTAYHPQANSQVERLHRTLKAALMARGQGSDWSEELPTVLFGLRAALRSDNNLSPALMTYGSSLRMPADFFVPTKSKIEDAELVRRLSEIMSSLVPVTRTHATQLRPFVHKDLTSCTHVFVRNDTVRPPLTPPYDGPFEVLKRYDKYFKIQMPQRTTVVTIERLKPAYIYDEAIASASQPTVSSPDTQTYVCIVKKVEDGGLKLNVAKTEYMACGGTDPDPITGGGESVLKTDKFKYLGSVLHESGEIDHDVQARISAAWAKWREVTGVLCDPRIPVKLKGLVYKSIIRPVLLYGSETWPALGRHVQQLHVTEMKMLRWMCIRDVADKLQESRLRWYGHIRRRPVDYVGNRCLNLIVQGPRSRGRGRPKKRWLDVVTADMEENNLSPQDAEDRAKWRRLSRKAD